MPEATTEQKYEALKRIHDSVNQAVHEMERELVKLRARVAILEAEKRGWQGEKAEVNAIIQQEITRLNQEKQQQANRIVELRSQLTAARGTEVN